MVLDYVLRDHVLPTDVWPVVDCIYNGGPIDNEAEKFLSPSNITAGVMS